MNHSINQSINYEGVCRTAPVTQGLLIICNLCYDKEAPVTMYKGKYIYVGLFNTAKFIEPLDDMHIPHNRYFRWLKQKIENHPLSKMHRRNTKKYDKRKRRKKSKLKSHVILVK